LVYCVKKNLATLVASIRKGDRIEWICYRCNNLIII
jgi:hypothetical protein